LEKLVSLNLKQAKYLSHLNFNSASLEAVDLSSSSVTELIAESPSLRHLSLLWCAQLVHIEIACPLLTDLPLEGVQNLETLHLSCPSLTQLNLHGLWKPLS